MGVGTVVVVGERRSDTEGWPAPEVVFRGQARGPSPRQIRGACRVRCDGTRVCVDPVIPAVEKSFGVRASVRPYPKPTLVVR